MRFMFFLTILFSLAGICADSEKKFNAATGWDWRDEDCISDDGLLSEENEDFSAQLRKIRALLILKGPFTIKDLQLGAPAYYYPKTEYEVHVYLSDKASPDSHIGAKIRIKPKNQHRFEAVLYNTHLEDFDFDLNNTFGTIQMISSHRFEISFHNYTACPNGTINIFKDGFIGTLSVDGKNIQSLQINNLKFPKLLTPTHSLKSTIKRKN